MQCPDRTTNLTRGLFSSPPEGFFRTTSPAGGFRFIQKDPGTGPGAKFQL